MKWLVFIAALIFMPGCRTATSKKLQESNSSLQSVHDEHYTLRLVKTEDSESLYTFKTCINNDDSRCTEAFISSDEEPLYLTMETISMADVSEEDTAKMNHIESEWGSYRQKLVLAGNGTIIGGGIGALFVGASAPTGTAMGLEEQIDKLNQKIINNPKEISKYEDTIAKTMEYKNTADFLKVQQASDEARKALKALGINPDSPPAIPHWIAHASDINTYNLYTTEFIGFLKLNYHHIEYGDRSGTSVFHIYDSHYSWKEYGSYISGFFEDKMKSKWPSLSKKSFFGEKFESPIHLIEPKAWDDYQNYLSMKAKIEGRAFKKYTMRDAAKAVGNWNPARPYENFPTELLEQFENFFSDYVHNKGIPPKIRSYLRVVKEADEALRLVDDIPNMKKASSQLTDEIASSQTARTALYKRLKAANKKIGLLVGISVGILAVTTATGAILIVKGNIKSDQTQTDLQTHGQDLQVVMDHSHALFTTDSSTREKVSSVEQILINLGQRLQDVTWVAPGSSVDLYCLPSEDDQLKKDCKSLPS